MNERQERELRLQLEEDERGRNRSKFNYTIDALLDYTIVPLAVWPESNQNVAAVINGEINKDSLPMDEDNEAHKGMAWTEQQDIILRNWEKDALCEAQSMEPCLQDDCTLYNPNLGPPVCREFKMVFKR